MSECKINVLLSGSITANSLYFIVYQNMESECLVHMFGDDVFRKVACPTEQFRTELSAQDSRYS